MVAGALLPVAFYKNKLYFLFGKENPMEDSSKGWSDFGGGCEKKETPYETALREGSEELTGFLGDKKAVDDIVKKSKGFYTLTHNDYHSHLFLIEYDAKLPFYFNNTHHFLWERMNQKWLNASKLFEKIEIQWFCETELKAKRHLFRSFYREIVDKIIVALPTIRAHMKNQIRMKGSITNTIVHNQSKKTIRQKRRKSGKTQKKTRTKSIRPFFLFGGK